MTEKNKAEISTQKRSLKLAPMLGDWTTYKPPKALYKKVKTGLYGFDRLSEEELKQAHLLHYKFAEKFCDSLKTKLRVSAELYEVSALQNTYSNFLRSFTGPIYQGKFKCENYDEEVFVSFDLQLIDTLTNAALGSQDISKLNRPLTEAEEIILNLIFEEHLPTYGEIFSAMLQNPKFETIGSPSVVPDSSLNLQSTFVHFAIEASINNVLGKIIFGYNGIFIKNLIKSLGNIEKPYALDLHKLDPSIFGVIELPISAILGKTSLTTSEIKQLEPGDAVSLDQGIDSALKIQLSDGHTILGQPGVKDGKMVIRIVAVEKEKTVKVEPPIYKPKEVEFDEKEKKEENMLEDDLGEEDLEDELADEASEPLAEDFADEGLKDIEEDKGGL